MGGRRTEEERGVEGSRGGEGGGGMVVVFWRRSKRTNCVVTVWFSLPLHPFPPHAAPSPPTQSLSLSLSLSLFRYPRRIFAFATTPYPRSPFSFPSPLNRTRCLFTNFLDPCLPSFPPPPNAMPVSRQSRPFAFTMDSDALRTSGHTKRKAGIATNKKKPEKWRPKQSRVAPIGREWR